ncbi:hypothetical protein LCGC14_0388130 [marine sediment metagenome]|uniref:Uncharacterized protein n=1 Tax=marine sediment metagenome TaxID=412755 RepID=A0A0F9VM95_9ZZZZ
MKGIVKTVQANNTWEGHGKTFYIFEVEIGEHAGQYMTPKFTDKDAPEFPFQVGKEADYEFEGGDRPKIKLPQKEFKPSSASKGGSGSNSSFALSYAKDVLVASYMTQNTEVLVLSTDQMFDLADKMNNWLNDH